MSAEQLIVPLQRELAQSQPDWQIDPFFEADATKAQLGRLLGGDRTPALLFSASHGMGFPLGSDRQLAHQGALLCQDWPGPRAWNGPIPQDFYMAGDDVGADARLLGLLQERLEILRGLYGYVAAQATRPCGQRWTPCTKSQRWRRTAATAWPRR